jgi:hypothetical protein
MCWSKHEREQWERERHEAALEAERLRFLSSEPREQDTEPEAEVEKREAELVRS